MKNKMETNVNVSDLLNVGYIKERFYDNKCILKWGLSDLISLGEVMGKDNGLFRIFNKKKSKETAKRNAYSRLEKNLKQLEKKLSSAEKEEILELKKYKEGKPQNQIEIKRYNDKKNISYHARVYVRGNPNYFESFEVGIAKEGGHFIANYMHRTANLPSYQDHRNEWKEAFHKEEKANGAVLKYLKEAVIREMYVHGMAEEAKKVNFVVVNKN